MVAGGKMPIQIDADFRIIRQIVRLHKPPVVLSDSELRYHARTSFRECDSETGPARQMMVTIAAPGKYIGLGTRVISERRKHPRTVH